MNGKYSESRLIQDSADNLPERELGWQYVYPAHGKPFDISELEKNFNRIEGVRLYNL